MTYYRATKSKNKVYHADSSCQYLRDADNVRKLTQAVLDRLWGHSPCSECVEDV